MEIVDSICGFLGVIQNYGAVFILRSYSLYAEYKPNLAAYGGFASSRSLSSASFLESKKEAKKTPAASLLFLF
ncbi:MAG: hypothetical protein HDT48_05370 [Ruminococcaceae bacterium]|nr:hypothetical protein [Oscillospiraceae bacterium]